MFVGLRVVVVVVVVCVCGSVVAVVVVVVLYEIVRLIRDGEKGGRGYGGVVRGRLYTYRYTVTTRMTSASEVGRR